MRCRSWVTPKFPATSAETLRDHSSGLYDTEIKSDEGVEIGLSAIGLTLIVAPAESILQPRAQPRTRLFIFPTGALMGNDTALPYDFHRPKPA